MSRTVQVQLFLLVLTLGFLTGPRVMLALQGTESPTVTPVVTPPLALVERSVATTTIETPVVPLSPYERLSLDAKSVYVWDVKEHRVLYAKNERKQLPLASVTKMMMALVAVELLPEDKKVTITPDDLREDGDSGLYAGEEWSLAKLLEFTLVASSNDGASAIASVAGASLLRQSTTTDPFENKRAFIEKMNEKARAIGLEDTMFSNETGLDIDSVTGGAYGTARDMAMLFEYIFRNHPTLFTPTTYAKIDVRSDDDIVHHVANTNTGVATVSGIIGSKTGYTDLAGGNLVVLVDIGIDHPVVIAVLGSTRTGRFLDVEQLITVSVETISKTSL
jgi:D-alanyl-D-alanine carboxypeptidase